jgi:hypothetical protein
MGVAAEGVTAETRGEPGRELDLTVLIPVLNEASNMEPLIRKLVQDLRRSDSPTRSWSWTTARPTPRSTRCAG